jgi:hypothetical protein
LTGWFCKHLAAYIAITMKEFFQWNLAVPGILLALMVYRASQREFSWISVICIAVVAFWFGMAIVRLFSRRVRVLTAPSGKRKLLSDSELEQQLGRERLDALSLKHFGGVMMTDDVFSGRRTIDLMFRENPEPILPFSGWVFLSSEESPDASAEERGLELHDCLAVLRVAPEVAAYLDMPPGTELVRTGERTFEKDSD